MNQREEYRKEGSSGNISKIADDETSIEFAVLKIFFPNSHVIIFEKK